MPSLVDRAAAAAARAQQVRQLTDRPRQRRSAPEGGRHARGGHVLIERAAAADTAGPVLLRGYASTTEEPYEMYDWLGPYTEVVSAGAFAKTLGAHPDVVLNYQHGRVGTPMARTIVPEGPGSLRLSEDDTGLLALAEPVPGISTTVETLALIDAGVITEMSFAFTITRGMWSPDYTEYRIDEVDIDRGDVSVVNYGANPATSIEVERGEEPADVERAQRARLTRAAQARAGIALALSRRS